MVQVTWSAQYMEVEHRAQESFQVVEEFMRCFKILSGKDGPSVHRFNEYPWICPTVVGMVAMVSKIDAF